MQPPQDRGVGLQGRQGQRVRERSSRAGLSLIEVVIAMTIMTTALLSSTAAFSSSLHAVENARRLDQGTVFLETIMEDLSAQPYANLLALNGNQFFNGTTLAASPFTVDLTVFLSQVDLLQVEALLTDTRSNRVVGRVTVLRSRR